MPKYLTSTIHIFLLLITVTIAYLYNNTFPVGLHYDEAKKVGFILSGDQDFRHPLLMLQPVRLANILLGASSEQQIARIGRTMTALYTTLMVLGIYKFTSQRFRHYYAFLAAFISGLCPTIVVHSHYFKEDMLFTALLIWTLIAYLQFAADKCAARALWLGIFMGLLCASHYKSIVFLLILGALEVYPVLLIQRQSRKTIATLGLVFVIAICIFTLVNWPAVTGPQHFFKGLAYEIKHASVGHSGTTIHAIPQGFAYHLRRNIADGMTWPLTLCSIGGLIFHIVKWHKTHFQDKVAIAVLIAYYAVAEISPSKPPPDDGRYMIPVIALLSYFSAVFLNAIAIKHTLARVAASLLTFMVLIWMLHDSIMLLIHLNSDTRAAAVNWLKQHSSPGEVVAWSPLSAPWHIPLNTFDLSELANSDADYIVVSSFLYSRFVDKSRASSSAFYESQQQALDELFQKPSHLIPPPYRTFAFSNPEVYVLINAKSIISTQ